MANFVEAVIYPFSTVGRAIGVNAVAETMRGPELECTRSDEKPVWAVATEKALFRAFPALLATLIAPITSRLYVPALNDSGRTDRQYLGKEHLQYLSSSIWRLTADMLLTGAIGSLMQNPLEFPLAFVGWKLTANAATHAGLDLADVVGKGATRLYRHFRPSDTTLAI